MWSSGPVLPNSLIDLLDTVTGNSEDEEEEGEEDNLFDFDNFIDSDDEWLKTFYLQYFNMFSVLLLYTLTLFTSIVQYSVIPAPKAVYNAQNRWLLYHTISYSRMYAIVAKLIHLSVIS